MPTIDVHGQLGAQPLATRGGDLESLNALLARFDIEKCVVAAAEAIRANFVEGNRKLAEAIVGQPRLVGYVVVNGNYVEASLEEQRKYLGKAAFAGLYFDGKATNQNIASLEMNEVLNAARRYSKPIWVRADCRASVESLLNAAKSFKALNFIMGGMGGRDWQYALFAAEPCLNIYIDPSGGPGDRDQLRAAVERGFERRLVFGSGAGRSHPARLLGLVKDSDLRPSQKERILTANAKELFGW